MPQARSPMCHREHGMVLFTALHTGNCTANRREGNGREKVSCDYLGRNPESPAMLIAFCTPPPKQPKGRCAKGPEETQ